MNEDMRVFFAIILPKPINELLFSIVESLEPLMPKNLIHWIHHENFHVTLQFLKNIQPDHLISLIEEVRVETNRSNAFYLEFSGLEWFPTPKKPKVLSVAIDSQDTLKVLSKKIGHAMNILNYPLEPFPFHGHLSLGRLLHHQPQKISFLSQIKLPHMPLIPITEFYLMESRSEQGKVKYYPITEFNLVNILI